MNCRGESGERSTVQGVPEIEVEHSLQDGEAGLATLEEVWPSIGYMLNCSVVHVERAVPHLSYRWPHCFQKWAEANFNFKA